MACDEELAERIRALVADEQSPFPLVLGLMYPSRTRAVLAVLKTGNGSQAREGGARNRQQPRRATRKSEQPE
jgi:hypothetical protein